MKAEINRVEYINSAEIPGVEVVDGQACSKVGGHWYPVKGVLRRGSSYIPVLDLPMMDEQPSRKAAGE